MKFVEWFLNIKFFIREDNFYFNESKGFLCFVGKILNVGIVNKVYCMGELKGRKYFVVYEDVLLKLWGYFDLLNKKLYLMVCWNFYWWMMVREKFEICVGFWVVEVFDVE